MSVVQEVVMWPVWTANTKFIPNSVNNFGNVRCGKQKDFLLWRWVFSLYLGLFFSLKLTKPVNVLSRLTAELSLCRCCRHISFSLSHLDVKSPANYSVIQLNRLNSNYFIPQTQTTSSVAVAQSLMRRYTWVICSRASLTCSNAVSFYQLFTSFHVCR
jgi:hypothetical protein